MAGGSDNKLGILAMCAAMAFFVANDTLLKLATATLPPGQIMAVRGLFASALALGLIVAMRQTRRVGGVRQPIVLARAALEALVAFLYITALAFLPLANIVAILQATPLMMTLIAVVLGIEQVGWRRWCAIAAGFAGVLLVVKPDPSAFNAYALIALVSALVVAVRDLVTRRIAGEVPSIVVTLSTTTAVALAGAALGLGEDWMPLRARELALLAAAAALVTAGNLCIIVAFRRADVSVVSPFRYTIVIMALALGFLVFGEWPDAYAGLGTALIVGSGLYALHRESVRLRALQEAAR